MDLAPFESSVALPIDPDVEGVEDSRPLAIALLVFAGGCLGGYARYAVTTAWSAADHPLPWVTLGVNTLGAFVLALVVVAALRAGPALRVFAGTGICGAFTTFSAVVVAADRLAAHGRVGTAAAYVGLSVVGGLGAAVAGLALARRLWPVRRRPC